MLRKIFILLLFVTLIHPIFSQQGKIDSLSNKLKNISNKEEKTEIFYQLAQIYKDRGIIDKSIYYAKKGLYLCGNNLTQKAELTAILAKCYFNISNFKKSFEYYDTLLKEAEKNKNSFYKGIAFSGYMDLYFKEGEYEKSVYYGIKAIKIFEKEDAEYLKETRLNLSKIYLDLNKLKEAQKIYDSLLEDKITYEDSSFLANIYEKKGVVYFYQKFFPLARKYYSEAYNIYLRIEDTLSVAIEQGNIAETYENEGKYQKALKLYKQAIKTEKKYHYYSGLIFLYEAAGRTYSKLKMHKSASLYYGKALELIYKTGEFRELPNIFEMLHLSYAKTGNYKKAYEYSLKLISVKDSILGEDVQNQINSLRIKYETEKTKKENEILKLKQINQQKQNKKQFLIIVIITILLVFVITFSILLIRFNSKNKKVKKILSQKNQQLNEAFSDIKKNIEYAGKIQNAMLLSYTEILKIFPEFIILYKPAYTLSGDFYWSKKIKDTVFIAVGDSTGHGVPGALLSITGMSFLNEIVTEDFIRTDVILNNLRSKIKHRLNQKGNFHEQKDGWDISVISYNLKSGKCQFSGAYNSIYTISGNSGKITKHKADRQPVGIYCKEKPFNIENIKLRKGDIIWMLTDGITDQYSEKENKKFTTKKMTELLSKIYEYPLKTQKDIINNEFIKWKGSFEQVDDILIMGIKI